MPKYVIVGFLLLSFAGAMLAGEKTISHTEKDMSEIFRKRDFNGFKSRIESDSLLLDRYINTGAFWDTPLTFSCKNNYTEFVGYLIARGANVNIGDKLVSELDRAYAWDKSSPLHIASRNGNLEISMKLIENGSDIDLKDDCGATPLYYAVGSRNIELIDYLIGKRANIDIPINSGETAIFLASNDSSINILKLLIRNGANVNVKMRGKWTPLLSAINGGHVEAVKYLISKGADISDETEAGWDAYYLARGNKKIVQILNTSARQK